MKKFLICILVFLVPSFSYAQCNNGGGDFPDCIKVYGQLPYGHMVPPGTYSSGATFILKNAGCLYQNTVFRFHSAFFGEDMYHVTSLSIETNIEQLKMFNDYPNLQQYLIVSGAFDKVLPLTIIDGTLMHTLTNIPFCQEYE